MSIGMVYDMPSRLAEAIQKNYSFSSPSFWMFKAFEYGVMQGKRMERAKRKRGTTV